MELFSTNIKSLAAERPFRTKELFKLNDCYGHAYVLKKYAGLEENYQIKAVIEHSAMLYAHVWSGDITVPLPAIFTFSDYRFSYIRQLTNKALFAIGPSIHYAQSAISEEEIRLIKKSLGKTLLVFLPHSSWSILENFDHKQIISKIREFEKEFNNILICLGWRDILRDMEKPYLSEGYTCVTAGHIFDLNFLNRLKTIILLSSHTMSFNGGTQVGFCVYLNRPHWISLIETNREAPEEIDKTATYKGSILTNPQTKFVTEAFLEPCDNISNRQKDVVDIMWGTSHIKSHEELKELIYIVEDMYKVKYMPCDRRNPIMLCQLYDYITNNNLALSKVLYNYTKLVKYHPDWMRFIKGLILYKEGKLEETEKIAMGLLRHRDFKEKGEFLKGLIYGENKLDEGLINDFLSKYPKIHLYKMEKVKFPWEEE